MQFICYSDWDQLPDSASALFDQGAQQSLYVSRPWFESLVTTAIDEQHAMLLASVLDGDRLLAILPLKKLSDSSCAALAHNYTPLYSLLVTDHNRQAVLECLAQGLFELPLTHLSLEPIDEDDNSITSLQQALMARGYECHRAFRFYNWFHRVDGQSFTDYMAERPARLRNTIARKQRKLEREQGYRIRLYTGEEVEAAMQDYGTIYNASWKANEQFGELLHDLSVRLSRPDWTRLAILYVADKPAAAQLWFVVHGKASIFRLAYDETWKAYSPGSILTHYLMQYVIDTDKVDEIDFLRGNENYKQDWMTQRRERWGMYCAKKPTSTGKTPVWLPSLKTIFNRL